MPWIEIGDQRAGLAGRIPKLLGDQVQHGRIFIDSTIAGERQVVGCQIGFEDQERVRDTGFIAQVELHLSGRYNAPP